MRLPGVALGGGGGGKRCLRLLRIYFQGTGGGARRFRLDRQITETIFFGEPPRGGGWGFRGLGESIPAPQIAFLRDEPLSGLQQGPQGVAFGPQDDADLVQPPRERVRRRDTLCEGFDARR